MEPRDNVTAASANALRRHEGLVLASLGMLAFSLTFPATKLALRGLDPWFISFGRAVVGATLAAITLWRLDAQLPSGRQLLRLLVVAGGVVFGFPALSTLALQSSSASHGAVVIAILPVATAVAGVVRTGRLPGRMFWLAALTGAVIVTGYTLSRAGGALRLSDLYLLAAVAVCAIGYAEGGLLAGQIGAPQTICWALVLSLPVTLPVTIAHIPAHVPEVRAAAGFAYVGVFSALVGFFAWYGGLARAGVAKASQVQLAQTPLTLVWSALILGESIGLDTAAVALAVLACIAGTQRARVSDRTLFSRRRSAAVLATAHRARSRQSAPAEP